jgi:hypothetical protein
LYIYIMSVDESGGFEQDSIARSARSRVQVGGVNAHLRVMPQAPGEYRVVLTFHYNDGQLCEAVLIPLEASALASEIAQVLEDGERSASRSE